MRIPVMAATMMIAGVLATGPAPAHATGHAAANIELVRGGGGFHGGGFHGGGYRGFARGYGFRGGYGYPYAYGYPYPYACPYAYAYPYPYPTCGYP